MGKYRIYGDPISGNCLKVRWTADLLGVSYDWIDVDVLSGYTRSEEFLAINPSGQVPAIVLPDGALDLVALRLTRGSVFETVCPHRVARLRATLAGDLGAADFESARGTCRELLAIDPNDLSTRAYAVGVEARSGRFARAEEGLTWLREHDAPKAFEAYAAAALADALLARDAFEEAAAAYVALLPLQPDEASRRQIEVKLLALQSSREQARILRSLLLGDHGRAVGPARAMQLTQALEAVRGDGLAPYLAARQLMGEGEYAAALRPLHQAARRGLPLPSLTREHHRMLAMTLYALGRWDELDAHLRGPMADDPALTTLTAYWRARAAFRRDPEESRLDLLRSELLGVEEPGRDPIER